MEDEFEYAKGEVIAAFLQDGSDDYLNGLLEGIFPGLGYTVRSDSRYPWNIVTVPEGTEDEACEKLGRLETIVDWVTRRNLTAEKRIEELDTVFGYGGSSADDLRDLAYGPTDEYVAALQRLRDDIEQITPKDT